MYRDEQKYTECAFTILEHMIRSRYVEPQQSPRSRRHRISHSEPEPEPEPEPRRVPGSGVNANVICGQKKNCE